MSRARVTDSPPITNHRKELLKLINQLAYKYSVWRVFEDFLALSAIAISNSVDWTHGEAREATYMEIVGQYEKNEVGLFSQMLVHLVEELERYAEEPTDVLGSVFHELELHNKYKGQFFTPQNICNMMGLMSLSEGDRDIADKGYLSVCEPCCGAGAMLLGFANAMRKNNYNIHDNMVAVATDTDLKCVYMCYLQLSLYGIPAVVIHGNSLTLEEWSRWYTPVYMLNGWVWRQTCGNLNKRYPEDEAIKRASEPMYAALRAVEALTEPMANETPEVAQKSAAAATEASEYDVKLHETESGQFSFGF